MSHCHPCPIGTSTGIILVLYILLVIILRTCWF
ncbi:YjcZ family sporulation protein [Paenibacillus polymyxa]|nr:YjcZ family sporulation protein [Paenibacillus polymyxa]